MFELVDTQQKNYKAIKWLLDETHTGGGRSTLTAYVFIKCALKEPETYITVFDPHAIVGRNQRFLHNLRKIFELMDIEEYDLSINFVENKIKLVRRKVC